MTNGTANPLLITTQSTSAASFFSVLAGTVGLPVVQGIGGNNSGPKQQSDSGAADWQSSGNATPQTSPAGSQPTLALATPFSDIAGANLTILPIARFQKVLSTTNPSAVVKGTKDQQPAPVNSAKSATIPALTASVPGVSSDAIPTPIRNATQSAAPIPAAVSGTVATPALDLPTVANSPAGDSQTAAPVVPVQAQTVSDSAATTPQPAPEKESSVQVGTPADREATAQISMIEAQVGKTSSAPSAQLDDSSAQQILSPLQDLPPRLDGSQTTDAQQSETTPSTDGTSKTPQAGAVSGAIPATTGRTSDDRSALLAAAQALFVSQPQNGTAREEPKSDGNDTVSSNPSAPTATSGVTGAPQNSTVQVLANNAVIVPAVQFLPGVNFTNANAAGVQLNSKAIDSKVTDTAGAKDDSSTNGTIPVKGSSDQNSSPASGTSSQNAQSATPSQHTPTDPSQTLAVAAKAVDAPSQTVPVHVTAPQVATSATAEKQHPADIAGAALPATGDNAETAATSGINTAKLLQTLSETQMHVGMRTAEFGDISIRTAVSQQQMIAQITVDHGDLSRAIAQSAPAIQTKLGDDLGLRAAIEVTHSGTSFSNHGGQPSQQEQRSFTRPVDGMGAVSLAETETVTPRMAVEALNADRLDIRA